MSKIRIQNEDDLEFLGVDEGGEAIFNYKGKPFTGVLEDREDGKLVGEAEYTDGHLGGAQREYHPNGQMAVEYFIRFNKLDGSFRYWDENGQLTKESFWKEGVKKH